MEERRETRKRSKPAQPIVDGLLEEHQGSIEELRASTRELEDILDEILATRSDLRSLAFGDDTSGPPAARKRTARSRRKADLDQILESGRDAVRRSMQVRNRSQRVRDALPATESKLESGETLMQGLSRRETQVLRLIVAGKTSKEIAALLGISFKTAVTHRASIMGKLNVHEIASVVREAIRRGLVDLA